MCRGYAVAPGEKRAASTSYWDIIRQSRPFVKRFFASNGRFARFFQGPQARSQCALVRISSSIRSMKSASGIVPRSPSLRLRTATAFASASLSPTMTM